VDTPGIHKPDSALSRQMMDEVQHALDGIDVLALMVDAAERFGPGDRYAVEMVKRFAGPSLLLLNKVDRIEKPRLLPLIERYRQMHEFTEIFPISALTGDGVEEMLAQVIALLPEGEPYFPTDQVTDQPERFLAAEIIREKAILRTRDELPHSLGVLVESFEEGAKLIRIRATIFVERDGQKGIVIGERGEMLKRIGTGARKELEELLGVKIFLELFVKVARDWRDKPALVRQMDWRVQLEGLGKE
jgi:GTP-binding protein Era